MYILQHKQMNILQYTKTTFLSLQYMQWIFGSNEVKHPEEANNTVTATDNKHAHLQ